MQPQFWQTGWFRAAAIVFILGIVAAIVRYISTQKLQRQLQSLQQHEALEQERARIARDLHDQLGANLTQVALLGEMAEADKDSPAEIESHAQQISQTARETTRSLDEIVWAVNPSNDTLEGLANYACKYAQEYLALAGIALSRRRAGAIARRRRFRRKSATMFFSRSRKPSTTSSSTRRRPRRGSDCAWSRKISFWRSKTMAAAWATGPRRKMRNGLRNMKKRMADIRGEFSIAPGANGGTIVRLTVPINTMKRMMNEA